VVLDASGRHRRPAGGPLSTDEFLSAPTTSAFPAAAGPGWAPDPAEPWPPQWDAPPPVMHPDHPSAPVLRVRASQASTGRIPVGNAGQLGTPPAAQSHLQPSRPGNPPRANPPRRPNPLPQAHDPGWGNGSGQYPPLQASREPRGNPQFRAYAPGGPSPAYGTGQGYGRSGNGAGRGYGPAPGSRPARGYYPGPGQPPAQGYNSGPGQPPAQGYNSGQPGFAPAPGYDPYQSYGAGHANGTGPSSYAAARNYQPGSVAPDYQPGPGYPQRQGHPDDRGNRRLHAVPGGASAAGPAGMRAGSRSAGPFNGRQAPGPARRQADAADGADLWWAHSAGGQADAIRHAAEQEAAAIRQAAEQDAAAIRHRAAGQAAAIRHAAEQEAAELRAHLLAMSGELGRAAFYVTQNLESAGALATMPAQALAPTTAPAWALAPASAPPRPRTRPDRPAARPATRPAARPGKKSHGRQRKAAVITKVGIGTMVTLAVTAGITEVALHGPAFFAFRNGGTGSSPNNLPSDQQFLAQQQAAAQAAHKAQVGRHALKSTSGQ
jgi:hypothetical protein